MNSIRKATSRVALGEQDDWGRSYRMDQLDQLDDERKKKLLQTQAAADIAERDPETGLLKVSGSIKGVATSGPGGDLYGVDPQGRAFVVAARKKSPTTPNATSATATAAAQSSAVDKLPPVQKEPSPTMNDMSAVPTALDKLRQLSPSNIMNRGLEADRQRRIARAEAIQSRLEKSGLAQPGEGDTRVVPLQPDDIRPAPEQQIASPREASFQTLGSVRPGEITPAAAAAFKRADELGKFARQRRLEAQKRQQATQQRQQQTQITKATSGAYRGGGI